MAEPEPHALVPEVAAEIMAHLKRYPAAGDTPDGIRQWWLGSTRNRVSLETTQEALEALVAKGAMGVRVLISGQRFYFGLGTDTKADQNGGES